MSMMPDVVFHVATLDVSSLFQLKMVVDSKSIQPWDDIDPAIEPT